MKTYAYWYTLINYAKDLGAARLNGDPEEIAIAERKLKDYEEAVRNADVMILDLPANHI